MDSVGDAVLDDDAISSMKTDAPAPVNSPFAHFVWTDPALRLEHELYIQEQAEQRNLNFQPLPGAAT